MESGLPHILHHSQQDLKNRVSQRRIKVFRLQQSQETRFLALVQDLSYGMAPGIMVGALLMLSAGIAIALTNKQSNSKKLKFTPLQSADLR